MSTTTIQPRLMRDRYWRPVIHLFLQHYKLKQFFTTKYFDLENGTIEIRSLKTASRGWSTSEKFMLNLALHLFNESNKLPSLGDMDSLDENNKKLAIEAIQMRFS